LALEAERAKNHLDTSEQQHLRHFVTNNLKHTSPGIQKNQIREWNIVKRIKQK
jgi:hypothetical protein